MAVEPIISWASPGGYYQSYLAKQCPGSTILTVENNATVVAAARDFFGFEGARCWGQGPVECLKGLRFCKLG